MEHEIMTFCASYKYWNNKYNNKDNIIVVLVIENRLLVLNINKVI